MAQPSTTLLPFRLTICGISELPPLASDTVSHVVSILDPERPDPEALGMFPAHHRKTLRFDDVVLEEPGTRWPHRSDVEEILDFASGLGDGVVEHLVIHCHAGVSRSTAAAAIIMAERNPGCEAEIFAFVDEIRPRSWPNSRMVGFADELLGRRGALIDALRAHHARVAERHPDLVELIRIHGRAHEVPGLA